MVAEGLTRDRVSAMKAMAGIRDEASGARDHKEALGARQSKSPARAIETLDGFGSAR